MTTGQTKQELLKANQQLRDRIETLEEVFSVLYGREMDAVDLKEVAAEAKARARLALIVESSDDAIFSHTLDGVVDSWNPAAERLFGYSAEEAIGRDFRSLIIPPEDIDVVAQRLEGVWHGKRVNHIEAERLRKNGSRVMVSVVATPIRDVEGNIVGASVNMRDISKRKQAEERMRLFRSLLDMSNDVVEVIDPETLRFIDVNETACRTLGYSREELLSMRVLDIDSAMDAALIGQMEAALRKRHSAVFESAHRRKDGSTFPVEVSVSQVRVDREYRVAVVRDITERKQNETVLKRINRTLRIISTCNLALVQAIDERDLMQSVVDTIIDVGGYSLAVVNHAENDPGKSLTPVAWAGLGGVDYWAKNLSWGDAERGQLPVSRAIRSGTTQVCHDIANEPGFAPWRDAVLARGYISNIALPLICGGEVCGSLSIYSSQEGGFDGDEIRLLEELAGDLSYGITMLRIRAQHEQHETVLRQALERSIQTIADILAARDPYTAGHQHSVDRLATAIAREMGLPEEQIDAIHFAAMIHDLGKIRIPAEILTKPSRLTEVEYMLVQTHPQAGYDIVKDVEFPWPIADIVLQHHERLDGSGYPQGLKEGEILLEAKVIAVADVVDAISSHRPYRPGLGLERALEEIEKGRGVRYDSKAVDACLKLFRNGYRLTHWVGTSSSKEKGITVLSQHRAKPKSRARSSRRVTK